MSAALMRAQALAAVVVVTVFGLSACRDEQAGPKKGPQAAQAAPGQPAVGQLKTLDGVPGELSYTSGATWAQGAVSYLGAKVEPKNPKPGDQVRISHYFKANQEPPKGWSFFVHVSDANTMQMLGNADHEVQGGAAPLQAWPVGKVIEDVHGIQMPNYPGPLRLLLGFWQGDQRLPVDAAPMQDGQNRVLGPVLEAPSQPLPEYKVPKTAKAPTIDGMLDDAIWKTAPAVELVGSFDGRPATRKTVARLAYDDTFLYVAFDAQDPDVWGSLKNKDDAIYNEDAVEVFLDADGDGKTYNELQVSPHNVQFDAAFEARRSDLEAAKKWESGMKSAVKIRGTLDDDKEDQGWSVEMAIKLDSLKSTPPLPPKKGDVWRFNLYRLEHHEHYKQIEGTAFSPLYVGDFHHLPRFAKLVFD